MGRSSKSDWLCLNKFLPELDNIYFVKSVAAWAAVMHLSEQNSLWREASFPVRDVLSLASSECCRGRFQLDRDGIQGEGIGNRDEIVPRMCFSTGGRGIPKDKNGIGKNKCCLCLQHERVFLEIWESPVGEEGRAMAGMPCVMGQPDSVLMGQSEESLAF